MQQDQLVFIKQKEK